MSAGQTGHMAGQIGHFHGTDGTHTRGCPAKILYVYCFFFPQLKRTDLRVLIDQGRKSASQAKLLGRLAGVKDRQTADNPLTLVNILIVKVKSANSAAHGQQVRRARKSSG